MLSISFAASYLLVMDASGSMDLTTPPNYQETRMDAAKVAAKNFIDGSTGEIAIMVFDDCDGSGDPNTGSIRVVQGYTTNKASLKSTVDTLSPYGDTAIADALNEAKTYIESTRGQGTIVLITDGEETCGGDPVAMAGQIYSQGTGKVHVIGYLVSGDAANMAKDIASAGGGNYYDVGSSTELEAALQDIEDEEGISCCPGIGVILLVCLAGFLKFN